LSLQIAYASVAGTELHGVKGHGVKRDSAEEVDTLAGRSNGIASKAGGAAGDSSVPAPPTLTPPTLTSAASAGVGGDAIAAGAGSGGGGGGGGSSVLPLPTLPTLEEALQEAQRQADEKGSPVLRVKGFPPEVYSTASYKTLIL
jgi:hypothetical protein